MEYKNMNMIIIQYISLIQINLKVYYYLLFLLMNLQRNL